MISEILPPSRSMATKAATKVLLTPEEQAMLKKMPARAQDMLKGRFEEETLTSFESEDELVRRMASADYSSYPEVKQIMEQFGKTGALEDVALDKLSEGALEMLLYSIGACGICAVAELMLQMDEIDRDTVEALAVLTTVRHRILQKNAK